MRHIIQRLWRDQRGDILPAALAALAVGALLLSPLLAHVGSSTLTIAASRSSLHDLYSADAGIEYALDAIGGDTNLRDQLLASPLVVDSLSLPATVNGGTPTIEISHVGSSPIMGETTGGTQALPWVLWAHSWDANHTIQTTGEGHTIRGGVHSNHNISFSGSGHTVYGTVRYVDAFSGSGVTIIPDGAPIEGTYEDEMPAEWTMASFAPGPNLAPNLDDPTSASWQGWGQLAKEAMLAGMYHYHEGNWNYGGSGVEVPQGLHYVTGNASLEGAGLIGNNVTVVSEETITLSGSNVAFGAYIDDGAPLVFYAGYAAENKGITIAGSGEIAGVSFAPGGQISLTGSGGAIRGAFIGAVCKVAGSGATIELADVALAGDPTETIVGQEQLFDIRSSSGGTNVTVRAGLSTVDGSWRIISWIAE